MTRIDSKSLLNATVALFILFVVGFIGFSIVMVTNKNKKPNFYPTEIKK